MTFQSWNKTAYQILIKFTFLRIPASYFVERLKEVYIREILYHVLEIFLSVKTFIQSFRLLVKDIYEVYLF